VNTVTASFNTNTGQNDRNISAKKSRLRGILEMVRQQHKRLKKEQCIICRNET